MRKCRASAWKSYGTRRKFQSDPTGRLNTASPNLSGRRPHPFLLASALFLMLMLWSVNYIAAKIALRHMTFLALISFRFELATLIFLALYAFHPRRQRVGLRDVLVLCALGLFGVLMNHGCFTLGLAYNLAAHASVILSSAPVLVLLLACALRLEHLTAGKLLGTVLAVAGVVLLATQKGFSVHSRVLEGDLITLAGSVGFAIYTVLGKKVAGRYDSLTMNTFNSLGAGIVSLPVAVHQAFHVEWGRVGWQGWAGLIYMVVGSSVIAYLIYYWALKNMTASRVASISYFQPLTVTLLGIVFLGEHPTPLLYAGGVLVLSGVYIVERARV